MDSKKCILIVDDEPNVRLVLQTALESVGYTVTEAEDGLVALERLIGAQGAKPCDLVLLDLQMPKMDGMELLSRLRAEGNVVPVVILTAHGSISEAVSAMKLGAIDFLTKPITPEALRRVVAEVIERNALPGPAAPPPVKESAKPAERSAQVALDLARAKRAINRGQFSEGERLLKEIRAVAPDSSEATELFDRLQTLKEQEVRGSFRILRDWFPTGMTRGKS
jgi:DNA-binding NtrC family response regulator